MANNLIGNLQIGRGLAATAVVLHHSALSTDAFIESIPSEWMRFFDLGAFGVDFFFVLSGFIIFHTHLNQCGDLAQLRGYFFKRFARIFPAYLPIGLSLLLLYQVIPGFSSSGGRDVSYVSSIFLLPDSSPPALSVAWTLIHELIFYFVFATWFYSKRLFLFVLAAWVGIVLLISVNSLVLTRFFGYFFSVLNCEFLFGVFVAFLYNRRTDWQSRWLSVSLIAIGFVFAVLCLFYLYNEGSSLVRLLFAASVALLILGLSILERQERFAWPLPLLFLGSASYSIYLVHNPLLSVTQRLIGRLGLTWELGILVGAGVTIGAGCLYFLFVERKLLAMIKNFRVLG